MTQTVEQMVTGLIEALNRNAAAIEESNKLVGGSASKNTNTSKTEKKADADAKAADSKVDKQPKVTEVQLHAKIKELASSIGGNEGKAAARETFSDLGYEKMAEIKPEHYDKVYDRCVAKLENEKGGDDL